jgi:hypothetical protein
MAGSKRATGERLCPKGREAISRAAKRRWRAYRAAATLAQKRKILGGDREPVARTRKVVKYGR